MAFLSPEKMQTPNELAQMARKAIATGEYPRDDLALLLEIQETHVEEAKRAELVGQCSAGCCVSNLEEAVIGPARFLVCKWTRKPCKMVELRDTIELLGAVNKNVKPSLIEGIHDDRHLSR